MYASFNYIDCLEMTKEQAKNCSHSGDCENDVIELMNNPKIKRQLNKLNPIKLSLELKDYGAWSENDLKDHEENKKRILWIAACNISEEL